MKGTLIKTGQGWMVSRCVGDGVAEVWEELLPLHPDDITDVEQHIEATKITHGVEANMEVEFEAVNIWERNIGDIKPYAKLVHHSVESNEMIDHIGNSNKMVDLPKMEQKLDEALANETSESLEEWMLNKREIHNYKLGLDDGYNLAKKTMFTEEDMHKAYCAGSNFDMSCLKNEQYYMFKNWFELYKASKL